MLINDDTRLLSGLMPRALIFGVGLIVFYTVVYRLYFHPLAKYPGPFWCRLTSFPAYYHTLRQDRHVWLYSLQEKYGTTFRYEPNNILINTPSGYKTIFGPKGNVKKSNYYQIWPRSLDTRNTWNSTDIAVHAPKRRILNHAFSDKALRAAEGFVLSNTDRWLDIFQESIPKAKGKDEYSPPFNMTDYINYLVFDILGDLCFGQSFDMKEPSSTLRYVPHLMCQFVTVLHPIAFAPFAPFWLWLKPRGLDWAMPYVAPAGLQAWQTFVGGCLEERTRKEEEEQKTSEEQQEEDTAGRKDFFHWLFHAIDPATGKTGYTLAELYGEAEMLTVAGSDTTAIVLSALFFYLARRPDIQDRLAAEIHDAFPLLGDEIKSGPALNSCKYLRAVLHETLRMAPPLAAEPARTVREGGTTVDGEFLPEGVNVSTGLYCLSYNSEIYPDPFAFRPERWVVGMDKEGSGTKKTKEEDVARAESGHCAFLTGTRGCPGKNLAWLEMSVVVAKVLRRFEVVEDAEMKVGGGHPAGREGRRNVDQYQTHDVYVSLRDGPVVRFKERV